MALDEPRFLGMTKTQFLGLAMCFLAVSITAALLLLGYNAKQAKEVAVQNKVLVYNHNQTFCALRDDLKARVRDENTLLNAVDEPRFAAFLSALIASQEETVESIDKYVDC